MNILCWFERVLGRLVPSPDPIAPLLPANVVFAEALSVIERNRPELAPEFALLRTGLTGRIRDWLDEHFPVDGGWGPRSPGRLAQDLRNLLEPAE